ncbi:MAG: hypothetical protein CVU16_07210 [Betaproteobacteria bacterium HGW-Betaproteobacteria-10]|nr:MAG: hypothetical protein CVU16_07210 [Betaproteobacteria bacterium HGW-Betaproteobacteria-10]
MNSASELRLRDIASPNVLTVGPEVPLAEAIEQFAENRLSSLVVVENGKPVGIITERDLLHLICDGMANKQQVRDVMSQPVLTQRFDLDFSAAQLMMSNQAVRHLVLVDAAGDLKGVASESDFRRHLGFDTYRVIQSLNLVIDQGVEMIAPEQTLAVALHAMASRSFDCVLIGRDGQAEGVLTERDIARLLVCQLDPALVSVGEFMTEPLRTISFDLSVVEAAREMAQSGLRHLVVLEAGGRVAGVLSQHRLLERLGIVLVEESRQQLENHLGLVLEETGVGSWEYDHQREMVIRSVGLNKLLNYAADLVYEKLDDVLARVDPEDRDRVAASFRGLHTATLEKFSIDYRIQDGDGEMRWVSSRGHVFERDAAGRPLRSVGVVIDIQPQKIAAQQLQQSEMRFRDLMKNLPLPVGYINEREELIFINQHFTEVFGYTMPEVPDVKTWAGLAYPDDNYRAWALETWQESLRLAAENAGVIRPVDYLVRCKDGATRVAEISGIALGEGMLITFSDVTERRQQQALLEFGNAILQHISIGAPLADVLDFIVREIEDQEPTTHCSVLILDETGQHLRHGAAPSLPHDYCVAIDGVEIGPAVGSCGTAAYRAEVVFVADIATDPLWENYKELALQYGLAACWSSPIVSTTGKVLGTFAVYWTAPYPVISPIIRRYVETATALSAIAIEGAQRDAAEHRMIEELRRWQQLTLGREGRVLELKREVNALRTRLGEAPIYGSVAGESA